MISDVALGLCDSHIGGNKVNSETGSETGSETDMPSKVDRRLATS